MLQWIFHVHVIFFPFLIISNDICAQTPRLRCSTLSKYCSIFKISQKQVLEMEFENKNTNKGSIFVTAPRMCTSCETHKLDVILVPSFHSKWTLSILLPTRTCGTPWTCIFTRHTVRACLPTARRVLFVITVMMAGPMVMLI